MAIETNTSLSAAVMDAVSPLHVALSGTGHVVHTGPTVKKLFDGHCLNGARVLEQFEVTRPKHISTMAALWENRGEILHLRMRRNPATTFKGVFLEDEDLKGGILALSFGIRVADAVAEYNLTAADFAPTDLAVEMLYLVEARKLVQAETDGLNERLKDARDQAEREALTDPLTGLANRRALDRQVDKLIEAREPFALMQIDLDHFKAVNDNQGHEAGDYVLRQVASVLSTVTRTRDTVVRLGGDEFLLVFPGLSERAKLHEIADRLLTGIEAPIVHRNQLLRVSASIGTTLSKFYTRPSLEKMLKDADAALYSSKNAGRAQHIVYEPGMNNFDGRSPDYPGDDRRKH